MDKNVIAAIVAIATIVILAILNERRLAKRRSARFDPWAAEREAARKSRHGR